MENKDFKEARKIAERSMGYLIAISVFALAWIALLIVSAVLYNTNNVFLLLIVVSAAVIIFCIWKAAEFLMTPSVCIKTSSEKLYFWFNRKWYAMNITSVGSVKTYNDMAGNGFNSLSAVLSRGTITITGKNGTEYKVKYVKDPEKVKAEIENFINLL